MQFKLLGTSTDKVYTDFITPVVEALNFIKGTLEYTINDELYALKRDWDLCILEAVILQHKELTLVNNLLIKRDWELNELMHLFNGYGIDIKIIL